MMMMSRAVVIIISSLILVGLVVAVTIGFSGWGETNDGGHKMGAAAKAVQTMCQPTDYKEACFKSLSTVHSADPKELIKAAFGSTKDELNKAVQNSRLLKELEKNPKTADAVRNCKELFQYASDDLSRSFDEIGRMEWNQAEEIVGNLKSWLSATITYQETCLDGFENTTGDAADKVRKLLETSTQMSSNGLAIISDMSLLIGNLDHSRRRLLEVNTRRGLMDGGRRWNLENKVNKLGSENLKDRANVVVAKNGGKYASIGEALKEVPKRGNESFIVYIKEGVYDEYLVVEKWMTNVVFVGDGPNKTRITHNKNFVDGTKTFKTATLSVQGDFFMAKDIGIENTAGAIKHQAVALKVQSDESIFYNVQVDGYQDTLYVHTYRQFYRNCRISGTIDFVFGDAAAFFQNCTFVVRKPLPNQDCIVTAQGKMERHQSTGIVMHRSRIEADPEYAPFKNQNKAFLGRPWKEFSRTIIMESDIGDLIQPQGWMPWNETFGIETCYYSEYNNEGPGSSLANRAKWRGIKKINHQRALKFMPRLFFETDTWILDAGLPYEPDLYAPPPGSQDSGHDDIDKDEEIESGPSKGSAQDASPSPTTSERQLSEIVTVQDLERMLMANTEKDNPNHISQPSSLFWPTNHNEPMQA